MTAGAIEPAALVAAFHDRTLPESLWTHEAHLTVGWYTLQEMTVAEAVPHLRRAITAYNDAVGIPNTDSSGYHETLTRYYVNAVDGVGASSLGQVFAAPECSRAAPSRHWSEQLLDSVRARRGWVEPDREPLPWIGADPVGS